MNVGAEARKTLLVVEDDLTLRSAMTDALESAGCTVLAARDGKDVLRLAKERAPDVILLDLALPTRSGLDVLDDLKDSHATRDIPVILVSAYAHLLRESHTRPAAALLQKPFNVADLLAQVERAVLKTVGDV